MFAAREKVFVSYSSANDGFVREEILPQIARARRDHWFAPRSIGGGDEWRMKLLDGLDSCGRLLIVVSREAQKSDHVKLELASATKNLLAKKAKLDARQVHRAILPVKLEPRGTCGETIPPAPSEDGTVAEVDPYLLHPYLTLVNFIAMPHNEKLNRLLAAPKAKRKDAMDRLSDEQRRTIGAYEEQRKEAQKRLVTAIRKPESLRWGFGPLGWLFALLAHPAFQRVALAVGLFLALTLFVPLGKQWARAVGLSRTDGPPIVQISTDRTSLPGAPIEADEGFPVDFSKGPVRLCVRVRTDDGTDAETHVTLRPEIAGDAVAIVPGLAFRADPAGAWRDAGDEIPVHQREDHPVRLAIRATANGRAKVSHVTLPALPRPADVLPEEPPAIAIRSESTGRWQDAEEPVALGLVPDRPTRLDIRATANGKETTSHVMLPALPALPAPPAAAGAPALETPTVAVRPETSGVWQDAGDAVRLGLREDGPTRLDIRAMANGRETTTHVMLPARPRPASPPPVEVPTITLRPETSRTWLPADDDVPLDLFEDRPTRLDIRAVANGREASASVLLPPRPPAPAPGRDAGPPRVRVKVLTREQWTNRSGQAGPDAVTELRDARFLELRASSPDGGETRHYVRLEGSGSGEGSPSPTGRSGRDLPLSPNDRPSIFRPSGEGRAGGEREGGERAGDEPTAPEPTAPPAAVPKLRVKIKDSKDPSKVGKTTAYDIEVINRSDVAATNVLVLCHLNPRYQEYVRSSGATKGAPREHFVRFARLDRLAPREKAAWRVVVRNTAAGDIGFRVDVTSAQVADPVIEAEETKIEKP